MQNDTTLLLIAQRKALGLNMTELADLPAIAQSKQVIADYESGRRNPAQSYIAAMTAIKNDYNLLMSCIMHDIRSNFAVNGVAQQSLPYFISFDDFHLNTGADATRWQIWQSALNNLVLSGKLGAVDDNNVIPPFLRTTELWLAGSYDATSSAEGE